MIDPGILAREQYLAALRRHQERLIGLRRVGIGAYELAGVCDRIRQAIEQEAHEQVRQETPA